MRRQSLNLTFPPRDAKSAAAAAAAADALSPPRSTPSSSTDASAASSYLLLTRLLMLTFPQLGAREPFVHALIRQQLHSERETVRVLVALLVHQLDVSVIGLNGWREGRRAEGGEGHLLTWIEQKLSIPFPSLFLISSFPPSFPSPPTPTVMDRLQTLPSSKPSLLTSCRDARNKRQTSYCSFPDTISWKRTTSNPSSPATSPPPSFSPLPVEEEEEGAFLGEGKRLSLLPFSFSCIKRKGRREGGRERKRDERG